MLEDDTENAFVLPSGNIFVFTGMLKVLGSYNVNIMIGVQWWEKMKNEDIRVKMIKRKKKGRKLHKNGSKGLNIVSF